MVGPMRVWWFAGEDGRCGLEGMCLGERSEGNRQAVCMVLWSRSVIGCGYVT